MRRPLVALASFEGFHVVDRIREVPCREPGCDRFSRGGRGGARYCPDHVRHVGDLAVARVRPVLARALERGTVPTAKNLRLLITMDRKIRARKRMHSRACVAGDPRYCARCAYLRGLGWPR